jgi:methionyl aminopeptidase
MSLKVGLLSVGELYEESLRKRVVGISQAAKLLMHLFDHSEILIQVGMQPLAIKQQILHEAHLLGATLQLGQIAFCRFGQVHPDPILYANEPLQAGESFTLDIWLEYQGYHADLARIYQLEPYKKELLQLKRGAYAVQEAALKVAKAGERFLSIVQAAQSAALLHGVHIVEGACGHGLGHHLHEEPTVPFCYNAGSPFAKIKAGSVITIEPLIALKPANLTLHEGGVVTLPHDIPFLYAEAMVYVGQDHTLVIGR